MINRFRRFALRQLGHPNFELVRHDVVNPLLVEVDQVYHLACPGELRARIPSIDHL